MILKFKKYGYWTSRNLQALYFIEEGDGLIAYKM